MFQKRKRIKLSYNILTCNHYFCHETAPPPSYIPSPLHFHLHFVRCLSQAIKHPRDHTAVVWSAVSSWYGTKPGRKFMTPKRFMIIGYFSLQEPEAINVLFYSYLISWLRFIFYTNNAFLCHASKLQH